MGTTFASIFFHRCAAVCAWCSPYRDPSGSSDFNSLSICIAHAGRLRHCSAAMGNSHHLRAVAFDDRPVDIVSARQATLSDFPVGAVFKRILSDEHILPFASKRNLADIKSIISGGGRSRLHRFTHYFRWQPWRARRPSLLQSLQVCC